MQNPITPFRGLKLICPSICTTTVLRLFITASTPADVMLGTIALSQIFDNSEILLSETKRQFLIFLVYFQF